MRYNELGLMYLINIEYPSTEFQILNIDIALIKLHNTCTIFLGLSFILVNMTIQIVIGLIILTILDILINVIFYLSFFKYLIHILHICVFINLI